MPHLVRSNNCLFADNPGFGRGSRQALFLSKNRVRLRPDLPASLLFLVVHMGTREIYAEGDRVQTRLVPILYHFDLFGMTL